MNKKTFTLASFAVALGILFLGSFYAWVISQFNEAKFLTKINYYFNKNFPKYELEVAEIDFKVSNKLRYKMENLFIKKKENGEVLLEAPSLTLDIPVGAFLGNREIRLKTKDLKANFESNEEFKSVFFSEKTEKETIKLDLPQLIDRNKFSFKSLGLSVNMKKSDTSKYFDKVFFKNLNMAHYTAFELDGKIEEGSYRLYGEVDLGNFLESRNIKMEAYLTLSDFNKQRSYLNDMTFKVVTSPSASAYAFKLIGQNDNAKGDVNILVDSEKLEVRMENFIITEKIIRDQLYLDRYYTCEKSQNTNIDGVLTYFYKKDFWKPDYSFLGDCLQVEHKLKSRKLSLYQWNIKFIEEQGLSLNVETSDFLFDIQSLEKVSINKEYFEAKSQFNLLRMIDHLKGMYTWSRELGNFSFPVYVDIKQFDVDNKSFRLRAKGSASNESLSFEDISLKNKGNIRGKGSLIYSFDKNQTDYSFELRKSPAKILTNLINIIDLDISGVVSRGRISQKHEGETVNKAFDIKITGGEFEWANLVNLVNSNVVDQSDKSLSKLLFEKKFNSLLLLGTEINGDLKIDWKYTPSLNNRYKRAGQLNQTPGNATQYSFSTMYERPSSKLKKYLLDKFGSNQVVFKLEKAEEFKVVQ